MKLITQVYRSTRKQGAYIFVEKSFDTSKLPEELLDILGKLEPAMVLALDANRTLANADPVKVLRAIESHGYYLQLPKEPLENQLQQLVNDKNI